MPISESARSAAAIHRKLRGLAAVFLDPAATEHEKANAERLKARLEEQLPREPTPSEPTPSKPTPSKPTPGAAWTNVMFRLGRGVREMTSSPAPPSPKGDWTDHAFRLGRMLRRGFKSFRAFLLFVALGVAIASTHEAAAASPCPDPGAVCSVQCYDSSCSVWRACWITESGIGVCSPVRYSRASDTRGTPSRGKLERRRTQ